MKVIFEGELLNNLKMYVGQLDIVIKLIEEDMINKDGLLIQLEGVKAQMEMDLE